MNTAQLKDLIFQAAFRCGIPTTQFEVRFSDCGADDGGFMWQVIITLFGKPRGKGRPPLTRKIVGQHPSDPQQALAEALQEFAKDPNDREAQKRRMLEDLAKEDPTIAEKLREKGLID